MLWSYAVHGRSKARSWQSSYKGWNAFRAMTRPPQVSSNNRHFVYKFTRACTKYPQFPPLEPLLIDQSNCNCVCVQFYSIPECLMARTLSSPIFAITQTCSFCKSLCSQVWCIKGHSIVSRCVCLRSRRPLERRCPCSIVLHSLPICWPSWSGTLGFQILAYMPQCTGFQHINFHSDTSRAI